MNELAVAKQAVRPRASTDRRAKPNKWLVFAAFVGPALLCFLLIQIIPFAVGIYYSFTSWNGVSSAVSWVGLQNFVDLFTKDDKFAKSFLFTFKFTFAAVLISNLVGFGLALLLNGALKTRNALRTVFFMPNVIGGLLLGFIWQFIFIKGFAAVGSATQIPFFQLPWLGDAGTAFWGIVIVFAWQQSGYLMVIYIAALQGVDQSILEASRIDGARGWTVLRKIVVPLIAPAFTICLFLSMSHAFKIYDLNYSLTGGGPFNSTESVAMNIYAEAFTNNRYGIGSAKALVFFVVVAVITLLQVTLTKRREVEA
ncbi:sugar ABC transporter permease [Paenibacillus sp.]|uniref:carbohydrate ABC transporter permease n=1 Tax=Paenibacillus sp. TaxID=58172 RepID=UPI002D6C5CEF|nr:sugar ABC transporter permease [Paenibacillus sp.]HZG85580.1 sugar ABC transporter permease [Paenibacillus sp.]